MTEIVVTATDFRVHLKDLANQVARGGDPVVMSRHGFDMVVMISWDDYQRWSRLDPRKRRKPPLEHPDQMDAAEVERIYEETKDATDSATSEWRRKALLSLWARQPRGKPVPPS
jgi:prevent-host-death family protein